MPKIIEDVKDLPKGAKPIGSPAFVSRGIYSPNDRPSNLSREALEECPDANYLVLGTMTRFEHQDGSETYYQAIQAYSDGRKKKPNSPMP